MNYKNEVYWQTLRKPEIQKLDGDKSADVIVIGGGMTGLMTALTLSKRGKSVILLEKDFCGSQASGKSSGFITPDSELELSNLLPAYGLEKTKQLWEFVKGGVDMIRDAIEENHFDCDYQVQDSMFIALNKAGIPKVFEEYESRKAVGYEARYYKSDDIQTAVGSKRYVAGVRYPETFGINSYLFCQEMRGVLLKAGVQIFEHSKVDEIFSGKVRVGNFTCTAKHVVFCSDRFMPDLKKVKKDVYHGQTFLAISKPLSDEDVKVMFPGDKLMVWDTDLIYQYYRVTGNNRLLIGSSTIPLTYAGDETRPAEKIYRKLNAYLKETFPSVHVELEYMWPGLIGVTKDFLPLVKEDKNMSGVYYVGAGAGLPWSAAIGRYTVEKIFDNNTAFDEYFDPKRFGFQNFVQSILGKKLTFAIFQGLRKA